MTMTRDGLTLLVCSNDVDDIRVRFEVMGYCCFL